MKENKYDDRGFFEQYSKMLRSQKGLMGAGEWYALEKMLPDFAGKRVLDLGCGFGWHCKYASEHGAAFVLGTDISEKMLKKAREDNSSVNVEYKQLAIEDIDFENESFDVVLSSLAFHYVESFEEVCERVQKMLNPSGDFIFSVEHPIYSAASKGDWCYDEDRKAWCWPVDDYYAEEFREVLFLGEKMMKRHRTMETYINTLIEKGFEILKIAEPKPDPRLLDLYPEYAIELRRPMFLLISARKK